MSTICDDLRAAILQAAMQGKLTKQLPEDGDAEELLERIKAEKASTRGKKELPVSEDEKLFEIPDTWRWQKLENISAFIGDKGNQIKESSVKKEGRYKVVSQSKELFIGYCDDEDKVLKIDGPVLVFGDHTALVKYIDFDFVIGADGVKVIKPFCVDIGYLYRALQYNLIGVSGLGGYSRHYKYIKDKLIPIPPLAEQKRIVEKVDELMARVADLEQSADALASLKEAFPSDIRVALLQAAMQGKLTKQLPEDGSADELLEQIDAEKEKLVAKGKIKKQKALAPITEKEIPFGIPENWRWARWGNIVNVVSARRVHQSDWRKSGIPFYRAREIGKLADYGFVDNDLFITQELFDKYSESGVPKKGDLMVTAVGTLGKTYVVKESDEFYYKDASVLCFENYCCDPYFLKYMMGANVMRGQIESNSGGTTVGTLTIVRMNDYILPLPPLAEQKRIVERLDALMQNIDVVGDLIASE